MEYPERKQIRCEGADYSAVGAYFITICTKDRKNILCKIDLVGDGVLDVPKIKMSVYGEAVEKQIAEFNQTYSDMQIDKHVIMPNHIHMIIIISSEKEYDVRRWNERIPAAVSTFKRFVNKKIGENIWQRAYNDHIIRERRDYEEICKYIYENPLKWAFDKYYN